MLDDPFDKNKYFLVNITILVSSLSKDLIYAFTLNIDIL